MGTKVLHRPDLKNRNTLNAIIDIPVDTSVTYRADLRLDAEVGDVARLNYRACTEILDTDQLFSEITEMLGRSADIQDVDAVASSWETARLNDHEARVIEEAKNQIRRSVEGAEYVSANSHMPAPVILVLPVCVAVIPAVCIALGAIPIEHMEEVHRVARDYQPF